MENEKNKLSSIFYVLYLLIHFVPPFWGSDVMGIQWLYLSVLDLYVLGYLMLNHAHFKEAFISIFRNKFFIVYVAYFLWAVGSCFYAINRVETLVCLARLITTFILFINLSVLFHKKDMKIVLKKISYIITLVAILDFLIMAGIFIWFIRITTYDKTVLKLCGMSYGNKNITAASMLINIPFIIYYINQSKLKGRILGIASLAMAIFSLFILSTRSTLVGMFLILIIYMVYIIFMQPKFSFKSVLFKLSYFILPVVFVYFTSNLFIDYVLKVKQQNVGGYGKVSKRIGDISIATSGRNEFWIAGIDYAKKHLLLGSGYGNWKIAALPYERERVTDFVGPYHVHNDFIENFAELGLIGGLLYLILFFLAFLFFLKIWFYKKYREYLFVATISFMGFTCYFVDACLNFPAERPVMQVMFAFSAALLFSPLSFINKKEKVEDTVKNPKSKGALKILYIVFTILLLFAITINTQVFRSFLFQRYMMGDLGDNPRLKIEQVENLPLVPNLSYNTLPIHPMLARYYIKEGRFNEAYQLLIADKNANPSYHYNDYVMSLYFAGLKNNDSSYYYSKKAFYNWPRAERYYNNIIAQTIRNNDTAEMNFAFKTYVNYRNETFAWSKYLKGRLESFGLHDGYTLNMLDSAYKLFPKDTTITKLHARYNNK